jgi:DNA-binding transcriptional ArsR family regulator
VAGKKKRVVLTDPQAIRALAHPARQLIIEELYNDRVLTATEVAELAGLTPSATSYHLRALERWGIVERADTSTDGRERPWQAAAGHLEIASQPGRSGRLAAQAMMRSSMDRLLEQFDELPASDPWDAHSMMSRSRLWLTKEEAAELNEELSAVVDRYRQDRTGTNRPADTRQVSTLLAVVPLGKPPKQP